VALLEGDLARLVCHTPGDGGDVRDRHLEPGADRRVEHVERLAKLGAADAQWRRRRFVEAGRVFVDGRVSAIANVGDDRRDRVGHVRRGGHERADLGNGPGAGGQPAKPHARAPAARRSPGL
jgi:hypothetical protein